MFEDPLLHRVAVQTQHPHLNSYVDLYVQAMCHALCTEENGMHMHLLTVLPHTIFRFHNASQHMACTHTHTHKHISHGK